MYLSIFLIFVWHVSDIQLLNTSRFERFGTDSTEYWALLMKLIYVISYIITVGTHLSKASRRIKKDSRTIFIAMPRTN